MELRHCVLSFPYISFSKAFSFLYGFYFVNFLRIFFFFFFIGDILLGKDGEMTLQSFYLSNSACCGEKSLDLSDLGL